MDVKTYMTREVKTISEEVRVLEALDMMKAHQIHRLPVVRGKRLVGLVTESIIAKHTPSTMTSLSVHEMNYLLTKTTVAQIMATNVVTVTSDTLLEEAAVLMREHRVGVLPVVDNGQLVGIITDTDIFEAFIDVLGYYTPGVRMALEVPDTIGVLENIAEQLNEAQINTNQIAVYHEHGQVQVVLQVASDDVAGLTERMTNQGYRVLSAHYKPGKQH